MPQAAVDALTRTNFSPLDWAIIAIYLALSVLIGFVVRRYAGTMTNYVVAGRHIGTWLGIATMTGTELGLITVMYSAEKGYKGGFATFHIALLAGIVTLLVGLTGFIVVPLRRLKVLTIPEFYERRFDKKTRVLGGIVLAFGGILNMGLFLKVGSMFIVGITGMSHSSLALPMVMSLLLILVLIYTVLGGMISVVLTDYVQFVILAIGMLAATGVLIWKLGWSEIFDTIESVMGASGFDPFAQEGVFGVEYVLWMAFLGLVSCAVWPTAVARALAMESEAAVKRQYQWSAISFTIRFLLPYFWGICAFVYVSQHAPDLARLFPTTVEQIRSGRTEVSVLYATPIVFGRLLPVGLLGLITAAMIAAFMSTHDSYLLCWSSVLTQDVIAPLRSRPLSTRARVLITRIGIVVLGLAFLFWGLFYPVRDDIWDYMAITGAIYFTGAIPVLVGGLYWKRASSTGAFASLLAGCSAVLGLGPIRATLDQVVRSIWPCETEILTSPRVGLFTIAVTATVFVVASLLFPDKREASK